MAASSAGPARQSPSRLPPQLLSGAAWVLGAQAITLVVGLSTGALLTRLLPPDEVAGYFLAVSLVTVAGVVVTAGIPQAAVRLLASTSSVGSSVTVRALLRRILGVAGLVAAPLAVICGTAAAWFVQPVTPRLSLIPSAILLAAWVAAVGAQRLLSECFRGLSDLRRASIYGGPLGSVLTLFGLLLCLVIGLRPGLFLVLGTAAGSVAVNVALAGLLIRVPRSPATVATPDGGASVAATSARALLGLSLPLMVTTVGLMASAQADLWVASASLPAHDVARYAVASRVAALLGFPLLIANAVLAPLIAQMHAQHRPSELQVLLRGTTAWCGLPTLVAFAVLAVTGGPLLGWVYGDFYSDAAVVLIVLAAGQVVAVLTGPCGVLLAMTGQEKLLMSVTLAGAVLTVAAMSATVGRFGAEGVAIAAATGLSLQNVVMAAAARRAVGLWTVVSLRAAFTLATSPQERALVRRAKAGM